MLRRLRLGFAIILAVALLAPAASVASVAPPPAPTPGAPSFADLVPHTRAPHSPADLGARWLAHPDPRDLPALTREFMADRAPELVAAAALVGTSRRALPWGDATGDGLADALVQSRDESTRAFGLEARRGTNGALLWARADVGVVDVLPIPLADVTGDARADVLLLSFTLDDQHVSGVCSIVCEETTTTQYHWTLSLLSGADGAPAWTRILPGRLSDTIVGVFGLVLVETWSATNITLYLDAPRAGDPGLVLDRYDASNFMATMLVNSTGELVDGASGATLLVEQHLEQPDFAILQLVGDTTGDAAGDLAWEVDQDVYFPTGQTGFAVDTIDGATLAPGWSYRSNASTDQFALPARADLSDDARADLFVLRGDDTVGLLAQGVMRWSGREGVPIVAGSIDGGAGSDAILVIDDTSGIDHRFTVDRVDGRTGATLFSTQPFLGEQSNSFTSLYVEVDLDGDGVLDPVVNHQYLEQNAASYNGSSLVESGRSGAPLWSADLPGLWFLAPAGDLDGDARDDAERVTLDFTQYPAFSFRIDALAMPSGAPLWSVSEGFATFGGIAYVTAGELDGAPGEEGLLQNSIFDGVFVGSRVRALSGATGAALWDVGDPLT